MMSMTNHFTSGGGEQNIAQGDHAIGKQENVTQEVRGDGCIFSATGGVTVNQGVPPELLAKYAEDLGETKQIIKDDIARRHSLAAAGDYADKARRHRVRLSYAKAAACWQEAAALLPEESKQERSRYLAFDLKRIGKYKEALPLYEQSLAIDRELGDREGEGRVLNNISQIYDAKGDYATALKYLEQSLSIRRELGDKAGEAVTSWNIGLACINQGDLTKAEPYMSRAVQLEEEIGHSDLEKDRTVLEEVRAKLRGR